MLWQHVLRKDFNVNYATIKYCDIANGEGVRTSLFVSGCRHRCPGCFNAEAFSFDAGELFSESIQEKIIGSLEPRYIEGLSVLGGEPFEPENQEALHPFLKKVRSVFPHKSIWMFSGFTYEQLRGFEGACRGSISCTLDILKLIDVLVDGPFIEALHDITLRFRGSSNQRLIDMPRTLERGAVQWWEGDPLLKRGSFYGRSNI